jgi:hypothetical protein
VASDAVVVEIMTVSAIDLNEKYKIIVFPNPTDDIISIVCEGLLVSSVEIINSHGIVIARDNNFVPIGAKRFFSFKNVPAGTYYVRIRSRNYVKTIPVLKH